MDTRQEVHVFDGSGVRVDLTSAGDSGYQLVVVEGSDSFLTLSARPGGAHDPILDHWKGVEVSEVEPCAESVELCDVGFRATRPEPPTPFDWTSFENYDDPLPQVIRPGQSVIVGGVPVVVVEWGDFGYTVEIGDDPMDLPAPDPSSPWPERPDPLDPVDPDTPVAGSFSDSIGHTFEEDIEWLAESGITRGCNPPENSLFCPDDPVTRGQMARSSLAPSDSPPVTSRSWIAPAMCSRETSPGLPTPGSPEVATLRRMIATARMIR